MTTQLSHVTKVQQNVSSTGQLRVTLCTTQGEGPGKQASTADQQAIRTDLVKLTPAWVGQRKDYKAFIIFGQRAGGGESDEGGGGGGQRLD